MGAIIARSLLAIPAIATTQAAVAVGAVTGAW
jgi:hypothetical protein